MKLSKRNTVLCLSMALLATQSSMAQKALVILKDSTQKEIQIKAFSIKALFIESENILIDSIASISFRAKSVADTRLYKVLEDSKVSISYDYVESKKPSIKSVSSGPKLYGFYIENKELYWAKDFKIDANQDSVKSLVSNYLKAKSEIKSTNPLNDYSAIIIVADWMLDYKLDGRGKLNYPSIYTNGKWALTAMVSIYDGGYTVKCKDFNYGGISVGTYYGFGVSISQEVAGDWQKVATKGESFRFAQLKSILLVEKNLEYLFEIKAGRTF